MDLQPYVDDIRLQLEVAAETGGEAAQALAERLGAALDAAVRLALLEALSAASQEITFELAPGSVELRLRGREPEFAVTLAQPADEARAADLLSEPVRPSTDPPLAGDDGGTARINLRMPEQLKVRVEQAASAEGLSVNAWLVRTVTTATERSDPTRATERRTLKGSQRLTGWAR